MINRIIDFSVKNKPIVLILVAVACIWGWWSMQRISLDAIPDLSETTAPSSSPTDART